jgi:hypothetical protein
MIERDRPAKISDSGAQWLACAFHLSGRLDEGRYQPRPLPMDEVIG